MTAAKPATPGATAHSMARFSPASEAPSIGVYVHFPWCLKKCPYCDFLSLPSDRPSLPHRAYADAILAELARRVSELGPRRLNSVFFGGGTPSLWEPSELGRVLAGIRRAFSQTEAPEVTVECNPTSFDSERARALIDVGINRVSIGVQGLDPARLAFLGRLHDPTGALQAVKDAISAGVPRVSADLIFGVAGQAPAEAASEVRTVAELGPGHVSAYALTIESGTQFGALARKGKLPLLSDELAADSFLAVDEALTEFGFEHYEISNYARRAEYAEHNLGYWRGDEYLGLGCGAWGTVQLGANRLRYRNTPSPERYLAAAELWPTASLTSSGMGELVSEIEVLDAETLLRERIMLGLRLTGGLDIDAQARSLGVEPWPQSRARAVKRLLERGRIAHEGSRWFIPKRDWLFADGTISSLL
jgi:putative oxygen-independent coproporphyrinogen III oxidase